MFSEFDNLTHHRRNQFQPRQMDQRPPYRRPSEPPYLVPHPGSQQLFIWHKLYGTEEFYEMLTLEFVTHEMAVQLRLTDEEL
jgi:hypothetical protein